MEEGEGAEVVDSALLPGWKEAGPKSGFGSRSQRDSGSGLGIYQLSRRASPDSFQHPHVTTVFPPTLGLSFPGMQSLVCTARGSPEEADGRE